MSKAPTFQVSQFIEAIPGTHGIVSAIAKKVGCSWNTAKKFIDEHPTVKAIYEAEQESILDIAESVLVNNIKLSLSDQQKLKRPVDSSDAKWLLARKGKARGYAERTEIVGADDGPVILKVVYSDKRANNTTEESTP